MRQRWAIPVLIGLFLVLQVAAAQANSFVWTDPISGGQVALSVDVVDNGSTQDWTYTIENLKYDPDDPFEGDANGLSGFQIIFSEPVAELADVMGPAGWTTTSSANDVGWSILSSQGEGIAVGESASFSFTTDRREIVLQTGDQLLSYMYSSRDFDQPTNIFRGDLFVPGALSPVPEPAAATLFLVGVLVVRRAGRARA